MAVIEPLVSFCPPRLGQLLSTVDRYGRARRAGAVYGGGMANPGGKTILIVDDEPAVRAVLTAYFEHAYGPRGFTVETAADGAGALAVVRRQRPALVLLDIDMPGMSGIEALRGMRAIDPRIPVIMVTGNEDSRVAGEVIGDGAYSYLPKPVRFQYLDHIAATVLGPAA
jgi:two-component system, NtrC family, response regulator HydG